MAAAPGLATIALGVGFAVYRYSRWRGRLPGRSFGALHLLLLMAAWVGTARLRPEGPLLKEGYWFPLAGIILLASAAWLSAALSHSAYANAGTARGRWGGPVAPLAS